MVGLALFTLAILAVAIGGYFLLRPTTEYIQGETEVTEYRVSSKVPGRVARLFVEEGDTIHAGDTLAVLDIPDVEAKREQATAAEEAAQALDDKARAGTRTEQVQAAYQLWQQARAAADVAEKSYRRIKNLFDEGVMARQKLDEATALRDAAVAQEEAARAQYRMAQNGARREDKQAATAMRNKARGAVREVDSYIKESVLTASADGEVSEIFPKVGELVGSGAPIMNVSRLDDMWVTFNVREDHLMLFPKGGVVTATVPALAGREVALRVYYLKDLGSYAAWKATKATGDFDLRTFEVKARPVKPAHNLRPGMTALVKYKE